MDNYQKSSKGCLNAYCSPLLPHYLVIMCGIKCLLWSRRWIMGFKVWVAIVMSNRGSIELILKFTIIKFIGMLSPMPKLANLVIMENESLGMEVKKKKKRERLTFPTFSEDSGFSDFFRPTNALIHFPETPIVSSNSLYLNRAQTLQKNYMA